MMWTRMLSIAPFLVGIANADANSDRLLSVARTTTDYPTARTSLVDDTSLTAVDLETALREDDWEIRQQAAVVGLWRVDPERARAIWTSEPGLTRRGTPGFAGELWRGSDAAPLMLERLIHGDEPAENRAALVGALRHTEGDWSQDRPLHQGCRDGARR